ncbi:FeoA family protein [Fluviispira vulneris]|uniref:FeoA family protein n=1 Tax=Fluviispira vulneris TaxID=2763012 RepID=UPI001C965817|nr:FeoA family protein [Fluviispira vulneris]
MQTKMANPLEFGIDLDHCEVSSDTELVSLCELKIGEKAVVVEIDERKLGLENTLPTGELEKRLLEMGFIEGTEVTLEHEGMIGKDPIAVLIRVCSLVALRRKEAQAILVRKIA